MKAGNKKRGFTLIELMITLSLLAIVFMVSFPSIRAYMDTARLKEARYNHQTIVYSIRMWSINNSDKNITPGNFSVLNSQGESVLSYLKLNNTKFYDRYLASNIRSDGTLITNPLDQVGNSDLGATYRMNEGRLTTSVFTRNNDQIIFDALSGVTDTTARTRYIRE